jgi:hypothetical protein
MSLNELTHATGVTSIHTHTHTHTHTHRVYACVSDKKMEDRQIPEERQRGGAERVARWRKRQGGGGK